MLYLTGCLPARPDLFRALEESGDVGLLITPRNSYPTKPVNAWPQAADNGCFSPTWDAGEWRDWIVGVRRDVLFATVPDVVADWRGTRARWDQYAGELAEFRRAYVLQDGQPANAVPWNEAGAVFVGGTTQYKLSADALRLVRAAQDRGLWVHMGRVNSLRRMRIAAEWGCDSVDGTFLAFGPDINVPRLLGWLRDINNRRHQYAFQGW